MGSKFPGGVAERRGNGLQIRVHGFKSRLHLGRLARSGALSKLSLICRPPLSGIGVHAPRHHVSGVKRIESDPLGCAGRECESESTGSAPSPSRAIGAVGARFPDTEEVTGSNPVSPTKIKVLLTR